MNGTENEDEYVQLGNCELNLMFWGVVCCYWDSKELC